VRKTSAPRQQRAQGKPGARCTRSLACEIIKHTSVVTTGSPVSPGLPCAMVLTVSFGLSPVTGLCCHRRLANASRNLTPASGRQDHTTSRSAYDITRRLMSRRPSHPAPNVRDDREAPLLRVRNGVNVKYIGDVSQAPRLRQNGTTGRLRMVDMRKLPVGQITPTSRSRPPASFAKQSALSSA
jgi:hypothetical protein